MQKNILKKVNIKKLEELKRLELEKSLFGVKHWDEAKCLFFLVFNLDNIILNAENPYDNSLIRFSSKYLLFGKLKILHVEKRVNSFLMFFSAFNPPGQKQECA